MSKRKNLPNASNDKASEIPGSDSSKSTKKNDFKCPNFLSEIARAEWDRIVDAYRAHGILARHDRALLSIYCGAYSIWSESMEAITKYGSMIKSPNGFPMQSPYVAMVNKQAETMMRIAPTFGLTPAARRRIFSPSTNKAMLLDSKKPIDGLEPC